MYRSRGATRWARRALRSLDASIRRRFLRRVWGEPRLTAAVMTRNGGARLPRLLSQLSQFADEIVVGVDASSVDDTLKVAQRWADRVYRFKLSGHTGPARELVLKYATGDWILSVDDDELVEEGFGGVVRELVSNQAITHAWFLRKWIVSLEPCRFVYAPWWYPDWQRRLFRNDRTLVHKPSMVHTGYWVSGQGVCETRASILHLEPVAFDAAARAKKVEHYRAMGSNSADDRYFSIPPDVVTRGAVLPKIEVNTPLGLARVKRGVHRLPKASAPQWGAEILSIDTASRAMPGEHVPATVRVRNRGGLAWMPHAGFYPFVSLGTRLRDEQRNDVQQDGHRFPVKAPVKPGDEAVFFITYRVPETPGTYLFEWDMISEGECWFSNLGSMTLSSTLIVGDPTVAKPALAHAGP